MIDSYYLLRIVEQIGLSLIINTNGIFLNYLLISVDAACSDMDRIKRDYLPKCDQILEQLKTTTGDSPRCR